MKTSRRTTAIQETWEAVRAAMDTISAREDQDFPSPEDPSRYYVPADFYHGPSLDRATQELDLLFTMEGRQTPDAYQSPSDEEWLDEVAQELDWVRSQPPLWNPPMRCIICGTVEQTGNGPPRNDGRPREGSIAPTFRNGVGMTTSHVNGCPTTPS